MKALIYITAAVLTFTAAENAVAQDAMKGMSSMGSAADVKTGKGVGVIEAISPDAGTVTLKHGAIPGVGWPAMTMAFKAKPALLKGLKSGQTVEFTVRTPSRGPEITALRAH